MAYLEIKNTILSSSNYSISLPGLHTPLARKVVLFFSQQLYVWHLQRLPQPPARSLLLFSWFISFITSPFFFNKFSHPLACIRSLLLWSFRQNRAILFLPAQEASLLLCSGGFLFVPLLCAWTVFSLEMWNAEESASYSWISQLNWNFMGLLSSLLNWKCLVFCPLRVKQVLFHAQTPVW